MSSKKLVCFLVISIIYGLIAVGGAHASIIGIEGVITDAEGDAPRRCEGGSH